MKAIDEELFGITHRTQSINQKRKGNVNEAHVAKILTEWTGHEFCRVPMSGGLRWKNRMDICGDVINTDPNFDFIFSVETKHVANLGTESSRFALRKNSVIYRYWSQCKRDAEAAGKIPFLMVRENQMEAGTYYIFLYLSYYQLKKLSLAIFICRAQEQNKAFRLFGFKSQNLFKISYETLKSIYNG
jgi:hypothetical protein